MKRSITESVMHNASEVGEYLMYRWNHITLWEYVVLMILCFAMAVYLLKHTH